METVTLNHWEVCNECGAKLPPGTKVRRYGFMYYCDVQKGKHPGPDIPVSPASNSLARPAETPQAGRPAAAAAAHAAGDQAGVDDVARLMSPRAEELAGDIVTREELLHLLEGLNFVIESTIVLLRK